MRATVAALSFAFATTASAQLLTDPMLAVSSYLTGLNNPAGIRFTGPNQGFVIEKGGDTGTVRRFANGVLSTALTLPVANDHFERGLLGIAVDPAFTSNGHVYLYHSAGSSGAWIDNRLTRYTWNGTNLGSPLPMGTFGSSSDRQAIGGNHNGGVLTFGPDGKLYGVTGDLNRNGVEQNNKATTASSAFTGGVFRLNTDGTVPADNPFSGDFSRWYAYGVRNSFGLAFDPATGKLWNTENGVTTFDEINQVVRGMNSGWNAIQGPDSRNALNAPADLKILLGAVPGEDAVYQDPKFSFAQAIGITSIQFLNGSALGPAYDDAVLIGEANNPRLWLLRLNAARDGFVLVGGLADGVFDSGDGLTPFGTGFNVTTDIQIGPDGAVYIAALGSGEIFRVAAIPEPASWLLTLIGLAVVGGLAQRRARRA